MGEDMRALKRTDRYLQNSHEDAKCGMGNGEGKELTQMTHGHEQWCRDFLSWCGLVGGEAQRGKNWKNCNAIINRI